MNTPDLLKHIELTRAREGEIGETVAEKFGQPAADALRMLEQHAREVYALVMFYSGPAKGVLEQHMVLEILKSSFALAMLTVREADRDEFGRFCVAALKRAPDFVRELFSLIKS